MTIHTHQILIADPDAQICQQLSAILEKEGFAVRCVSEEEVIVHKVLAEKPRILILEVAFVNTDGVEICRNIREHLSCEQVLILFLTHRSESYTEIAALEAGGDDFMVKPAHPWVLIARLKALLRRCGRHDSAASGSGKNLHIDTEKMMVFQGSKTIELPNKEFRLLNLLASAPGKVFSRKEIIEILWGKGASVDRRVIDVYLRNLRKKLGVELFKTVKGAGYKYVVS